MKQILKSVLLFVALLAVVNVHAQTAKESLSIGESQVLFSKKKVSKKSTSLNMVARQHISILLKKN